MMQLNARESSLQPRAISPPGRRPVAAFAILCFALALLLLAAPWAAANAQAQPTAGPDVLEVFVRDGCPHCADAKEFLPAFANERPWLQIVYRSVDRDQTARDDLVRHSRNAGIWPPGVPTFVFNDQVLMGFASPEHTGPKLAALVAGHATLPAGIETGLFGTLDVADLGLPLFTLAVGLLDGSALRAGRFGIGHRRHQC